MDTTDPAITFNEKGHCNHCTDYFNQVAHRVFRGSDGEEILKRRIAKIKQRGRRRPYDAIVGISGGVDSAFTAYLAKSFGLRLLLVHFDNGWNSELSVRNIEQLARRLDVDLYTYVMDWEEFKDLQLSFLKASVVDIEMLTDHAIMATMVHQTRRHGIRAMLPGTNFATEAILPNSWFYPFKWDIRNIKAIHNAYGTVKRNTFPVFGLLSYLHMVYLSSIETVEILNHLDYNREEAISILEKEVGFKRYGAKHHESTFTKFYQAYILPRKFSIDKRRAHLSTQICSGQITREQAMQIMKQPPVDEDEAEWDKSYVLKKLGLSEMDFADLMNAPRREHSDFKNSLKLYYFLRKMKNHFIP